MERTVHSQEDRQRALQLCDEIGVKKTSEQIGVPTYTLYAWRRKANEAGVVNDLQAEDSREMEKAAKTVKTVIESAPKVPHETDNELYRLRLENRTLQEENLRLKKALRVFTEQSYAFSYDTTIKKEREASCLTLYGHYSVFFRLPQRSCTKFAPRLTSTPDNTLPTTGTARLTFNTLNTFTSASTHTNTPKPALNTG